MTDSQSQPRVRDAGEHQVRQFLEQAAPVILESRTLDGERFEQILQLARRSGLSRAQLLCELRLLEARGVLSDAPWHRLEVPAEPESEPTRKQISPPPLPTALPAAKGKDRRGKPAQRSSLSPPIARPGDPAQSPATGPSREDGRIGKLRMLVQRLYGAGQPLGRRDRRRVQKAARRLGLGQDLADKFIEQLRPTATEPSAGRPAEAAGMAESSGRAKTARPAPAERFARWVAEQLVDYAHEVLFEDDEAGLVGVGRHRFHLAEVLATHVVREVATDAQLRLERDLNVASCHSTADASVHGSAEEARLKTFFDRVAPILAQYRGINTQSRTLINAVADELGMDREELERAVMSLQRTRDDQAADDPHQQERRESFRAYLRRALAQSSDAIITHRVHRRLVEAGEHFHGVAPAWIQPTINDVALEVGARFISRQQAEGHVRGLVRDILLNRRVIDAATRGRVYAEGDRWGLEPMEVESILREEIEKLRAALAADRRRTRWILLAAGIGVTAAGIMLSWVLLPSFFDADYQAITATPKRPARSSSTGPRTDADWWNEDVRISLVNVRRSWPQFKQVLPQLASMLANQRGRGYELVIQHALDDIDAQQDPDPLQVLIAPLYAGDPSEEAADRLLAAVMATLSSVDTRLPASAAAASGGYWACQTLAMMYKYEQLPQPRASALSAAIGDALDLTPSDGLLTRDLAKQMRAALTRKLYDRLIAEAESHPRQANDVFWIVSAAANQYLTETERDQKNGQWLAAILPQSGVDWTDFDGIIRRLAQSTDPQLVWNLVRVYQRSENQPLKNFLEAEFLERLAIAPGTLSSEELVEAMRSSLGLVDEHRVDERWAVLQRDARRVLAATSDSDVSTTSLLQDTVELARLATLAVALTEGDAGSATYDKLYAEGSFDLTSSEDPEFAALETSLESGAPRTQSRMAEQYIRTLVGASDLRQRKETLPFVAGQATDVDDIDLAVGQLLAAYLVRPKSDDQEHQLVVTCTRSFARWNAVLLGLADQLELIAGGDSQLTALYSAAVGGEARIESAADRREVRRLLLQQVAQRLRDRPSLGRPTDARETRTIDRAREAMAKSYREQLRLLGITGDPVEQEGAATEMRQMIDQLAARLVAESSGRRLPPRQQTWLGELSRRLTAVESVAANDVQYLSMLSEIWLRLLGIRLVRLRPARRVEVEALLSESPRSGTDGTVLEQLRRRHRELLQLWLLFGPAEELPAPVET